MSQVSWDETISIGKDGDADFMANHTIYVGEPQEKAVIEFYLSQPAYTEPPKDVEISVEADTNELVDGKDYIIEGDNMSDWYAIEIFVTENHTGIYRIHLNFTLEDFVRKKSSWSGVRTFYLNKNCLGAEGSCLQPESKEVTTELKIDYIELISFPDNARVIEDGELIRLRYYGMKYSIVNFDDVKTSRFNVPITMTVLGAILGAFFGAIITCSLGKKS